MKDLLACYIKYNVLPQDGDALSSPKRHVLIKIMRIDNVQKHNNYKLN
jgi:hypothetical protein